MATMHNMQRSWVDQDLALETVNLMGTILAGVSYGIVLELFILVMTSSPFPPRRSWKFLAMIIWLFTLATTCVGFQIRWTVVAIIDNWDYPGGPNKFIQQNVGNWIDVMLNAIYVVVTWTADLTILYRFYVIYGSKRLWCIFPSLVFLATIGSSEPPYFSVQLTTPGTTQSTGKLADWSIAYRTLSLSLSVFLTTAIVGRILHLRHTIRKSGLRADGHYLSVVTVLVESASLETTTALIYIICVGINSPLQTMFLPVLAQVQVISPLLIIYRVARGRAWSTNTTHDLSQSLPSPASALSFKAARPSLKVNTDPFSDKYPVDDRYDSASLFSASPLHVSTAALPRYSRMSVAHTPSSCSQTLTPSTTPYRHLCSPPSYATFKEPLLTQSSRWAPPSPSIHSIRVSEFEAGLEEPPPAACRAERC